VTSDAVELVRRAYDAFETDGIEGIIPLLDAQVEWRNPPDSPIAGVFHGHDGVREWRKLTYEVFDELHFSPEEVLEAPDARVLAISSARLRGRGSDVLLEFPFAHVVQVRNGSIVAVEMYSQVADARAAVGLSSSG
jgi:ketosteroid isomerase-like protein